MDIFYSVKDLSLPEKVEICNQAYWKNTNWWVDGHGGEFGWTRVKVDMDYDTIMNKLNQSCHFTVINRDNIFTDERFGEIGFCEMKGDVNYFLWIYVTLTTLDEIIRKFNLKPMEQ